MRAHTSSGFPSRCRGATRNKANESRNWDSRSIFGKFEGVIDPFANENHMYPGSSDIGGGVTGKLVSYIPCRELRKTFRVLVQRFVSRYDGENSVSIPGKIT
jgi:hypothetical protein